MSGVYNTGMGFTTLCVVHDAQNFSHYQVLRHDDVFTAAHNSYKFKYSSTTSTVLELHKMDSEVQIIVCFFTFGLIAITQCEVYDGTITVDEGEDSCFDEYCGVEFNPYSPLIKCEYL